MVDFLVGRLPPGTAINLADALVAPDLLRPYLRTGRRSPATSSAGVEADSAADATPETAALLQRLLSYKDVRSILAEALAADPAAPVLAMHFKEGPTSLRLFTTITSLGTPRDITLQELRIESFFPMDEPTRAAFRNWAAACKEPRRHDPHRFWLCGKARGATV
jgi:MmyB-like transcription regulator ligand binding domain